MYLLFLGPIGTPEMMVIFFVILLLFGAKKIPQLARGFGKSMGEFKKARDEFEHEITRAEDEVTGKSNKVKKRPSLEEVEEES